ncbi:MAG: hypothetical protein HC875_20500 [Anaerolineales bacterium]|nr:hypothetical protein [Anaerolineales bacterium]
MNKDTLYQVGGTKAEVGANHPEVKKVFANLASSLSNKPTSLKVDVIVSLIDAVGLLDEFESIASAVIGGVKKKRGEKTANLGIATIPGEANK